MNLLGYVQELFCYQNIPNMSSTIWADKQTVCGMDAASERTRTYLQRVCVLCI